MHFKIASVFKHVLFIGSNSNSRTCFTESATESYLKVAEYSTCLEYLFFIQFSVNVNTFVISS